MKIDILAIGAHPDDIELGCGGTIIKHVDQGLSIGIIDLTMGELGTRGSAKIRESESNNAKKILGVDFRKNLKWKDGFFENSEENVVSLIKEIRQYKPDIVITNAPSDRHPDHQRASDICLKACFLSGLEKIDTSQDIWRPKHVYHYIQFKHINPDFVIDISEFIDRKIESVMAYKSQFYDPDSNESDTIISSKEFLESVRYRAQDLGRQSNCLYAEGFISAQNLKVKSLIDLI